MEIIGLSLVGLFLLYKLGVVKAVSVATEATASVTEVYAKEIVDRAEFDCAKSAGKRVEKAKSDKTFARPGDWKQHLSTTEQ